MFQMAQAQHHAIEDCEAFNKALYKFYAAVMIVIFILALPLNASVLHLLVTKLKFWKSSDIFLFNLVLADVLLLLCLPVKAHNFLQGERRSANDFVCRAMLFMLFLSRGASVAFLTVTSVDRCFDVVHPGQKRNLLEALKKSPQISILIWLFLLPLTTIPTVLNSFECCNSLKGQTNGGASEDALIKDVVDGLREVVFFVAILVPFVILVYCAARVVVAVVRQRRKTTVVGDETEPRRRDVLLVTSVAAVFSLCFLPCSLARAALLVARVQEWKDIAEARAARVFDGLVVLSYVDCLLVPLVCRFCSAGLGDMPFFFNRPSSVQKSPMDDIFVS